MKVAVENGRAVIDAADLGTLLGLEPAEVVEKMRLGEITSLYETGAKADAGRFRMTFTYADKRVRLTCAQDGTVLSTVRTSKGKR